MHCKVKRKALSSVVRKLDSGGTGRKDYSKTNTQDGFIAICTDMGIGVSRGMIEKMSENNRR